MDGREDYYLIGMLDYLQSEQFARFAKEEFVEFCQGFVAGGMRIRKGLPALNLALQVSRDLGVLEELHDDFAGPHYLVLGSDGALKIEQYLAASHAYQIYERMGEDRPDWLGRAFDGIERSKMPTAAADQDEDGWEPLQLERDNADIQTALEHAENAVASIKADNGFATTHAAVRDNLVIHAESTIAAAKEGTVTKNQVRHNLIRAGRWLADKFTGSALGSLGSELVKWGLRLLGFL